ncbi:MAG: hypothetical protein U0892_06100 [Pirellulales bacterium]
MAYKHAKTVIMASVTEGFACRIIEAWLSIKSYLRVILPFIGEVGGSYVRYFPIDGDTVELQSQIADSSRLAASSAVRRSRFKPVQWNESYRQLIDRIEQGRAATDFEFHVTRRVQGYGTHSPSPVTQSSCHRSAWQHRRTRADCKDRRLTPIDLISICPSLITDPV